MSRKKAKSISTFNYSILYTAIPHKTYLEVLSEVINFVIKFKVRKGIGFSKISIYWTSKGARRIYFTKPTFVDAMPFLINKCVFTADNMVFKQDTVIPMGIDPAPVLANLFLFFLNQSS